jgi:sugar transferase (PEP-CTERM/EpsH1 system associated)
MIREAAPGPTVNIRGGEAADVNSGTPSFHASKPLRILHVINRLWRGGMEYGVLKLATNLDAQFFEQRVCSLRGADEALADLRPLEKGSFLAGSDAGRQFELWRLVNVMRRYQPHIVHARNWGAIEAVAAARLARVPVVIHSEHGYGLEMLAGLPLRQRLLRSALYTLADRVFTVTRDLRNFHARQAWISPQKIGVIYNGVDIQRFAPCLEIRCIWRKKLGLPVGAFTIGCVARMVELKDHMTILRAAENLISQRLDIRVLLVGGGPELARYQQYVANSPQLAGRVLFSGASENIPELLNAMDVFVLPSKCEGMSNTLLEAMATGLPAVATQVGGNPEVIEDGSCGWLFPAGDVDSLAMCLCRFVTSTELCHKFGLAARRRAVEQFGLERMLKDYRSLYLDCAGRRGLLRFD